MNERDVVARLAAAGCVAAEAETVELLAVAADGATLETMVQRRQRGEPLPWIVGSTMFAGRRLHIAPGVYVPRPQSEDLARRAAARLPKRGAAIDLCTGSGAIAGHLMAKAPSASVVGVDLDPIAAACARTNGVLAVVADLEALPFRDGTADVVVAVAPYVPTAEVAFLPADVQAYEPRAALDGGADGLDLVRRVIAAARRLLRPGGWVLTEIGGDQDERLAAVLIDAGFCNVEVWHDEDGDLRGIAAERNG